MGQGTHAKIALTGIAAVFLFGCGGSTNNSDVASFTPNSTGMEAPTDAALNAALAAEFARLGIDPQRQIASAPEGERNAVLDLSAVQIEPDATPESTGPCIRLSWTERLAGDFDQNGAVLVSDLSALGQNFGRTVDYLPAGENGGIANLPSGGTDSENARLARVDGDGNGVINLADLAVIAQHYQQRLDGYRIYRQGPGEEGFTLLPNPADPELPYTVGRSEAMGGGSTAVHFMFDDPVSVAGGYDYYVAGFDSDSGTEGRTSFAHGGGGPGGGPGDDPIIEFSPPPLPDPDPDPAPLPEFEGSILLIRNDNDNHDVNYDAITSDLDDLSASYEEIDYYDGVDNYFLVGMYDLAIWYRGGPGGNDTTTQTQSWSEEEISNIQDILAADGDLLMLSQNHSIPWSFDGTFGRGWDYLTDYEVVSPYVVSVDDLAFCHMEGLANDDGFGWGGEYGFFPNCPVSVTGHIESTLPDEEYGTGRTDGEYFSGTDSSGRAPYQLRLPDDTQFMARSYSEAFFGGFSAAPGFRTGLEFLPLEISTMGLVPPEDPLPNGVDIPNYASWGCTNAPYQFGGYFPNYDFGNGGNARYWIVGYAWNDVEIISDPESSENAMVRAELLLNTLAWLMQ